MPKSAWRRFCAIALLGLILFGIASIDTISIAHNPSYSWPENVTGGIGPGEAEVSLQIEPNDLDLKWDVLGSLYFHVEVLAGGPLPFTGYLFWYPEQSQGSEGLPPRNSNGTLDWTSQTRTAVWDFSRHPEKGEEPFSWRMKREGFFPWSAEYPWEQYSFVLVFGFNRTMNLARLASTVNFRPGLDQWKVHQTFRRVGSSFIDALGPLGFSSDDLRRLSTPSLVEFCELKLVFTRQEFEILRGLLAFWMPSLLLGGLLFVAWTRRRVMETSNVLTLFIGTGLATLPFIVGAIQLLPPRLNAVEILFYLEIAFSITFAAWATSQQKKP